MELILLRHAETSWNAAGRYQGWEDIELSARGRASCPELARELTALLPEDFELWSSDLRRASETARLLFARAPRTDPRLRELDFGDFSGKSWDENVARFGKRFRDWVQNRGRPAPPGGEGVDDFLARTRDWLDEVRAVARPVVAVTHGGVIRTLVRPFAEEERWPGHGEVTVLRFPPHGEPRVVRRRSTRSETGGTE